jgi:hypothetical protein
MSIENFTRWQQRTIEQLGFNINLILTLAVAALGYTLTTYEKQPATCPLQHVFVLASTLLLLAVAFGVLASVTRLYDFRYTARTNREKNDLERHRLRTITDSLGNCTWFFFWAEILIFSLGVFATTALTLIPKL